MIRKLQINNYKSLHELELDIGRFNVLIGENGCGKSNVLEVIALAAAAAADKLDNEFLASRGIRVTDPQLMRSAFSIKHLSDPIQIGLIFENLKIRQQYSLNNDNQTYSKWSRLELDGFNEEIFPLRHKIKKQIDNLMEQKMLQLTQQFLNDNPNVDMALLINAQKNMKGYIDTIKNEVLEEVLPEVSNKLLNADKKAAQNYLNYSNAVIAYEDKLKNFLIYSPENTALRNFSKEGQIEPLGINGEGLLKLLKVIQSKSPEQLEEIVTCLELFDWFDSLHIPKDFSSYEDKVTITDRFLSTAFDQRSANEGFLFVLFYIALMVSDDTPKIFAIDNIDVALNPKLCTKLIKELVRLAKKYDKQVFVTTHNPAILDGIDLGDDEQRLLVLSRNKAGHTRVKRIELKDKPRSSTDEELRLSEAFLRGYLGGLPKGF